MYLNEMTHVVVDARRHDLLAEADAWRRTRSLAGRPAWSSVPVRRAIGDRLVRLGEMVAGYPAPASPEPVVTTV